MTWYVVRQDVPLHQAPAFDTEEDATAYLRTLKPELKAVALELLDGDAEEGS